MKVLIIGAKSFLGNFLYNDLSSKGYEVYGTARKSYLKLNILNYSKLCDVIKKIQPEFIFHLAAQSSPPKSWSHPKETLTTNILGSLNVLEAVRHFAPKARVLMVGSSASYGTQNILEPIKETANTFPNSPYGISKLAQDNLSLLYNEKYNLNIICARPFFLIGPGKTGDVCSDFAQRIIKIEKKQSTKISVGNLEIIRDFLDYRDGVNAMETILKKGRVGEIYNICGGDGYSLKEIIHKMSSIVGFKIKLENSQDLFRSIDSKIVVGNNAKLSKLGWKKQYDINNTLFDILNFWRHI